MVLSRNGASCTAYDKHIGDFYRCFNVRLMSIMSGTEGLVTETVSLLYVFLKAK